MRIKVPQPAVDRAVFLPGVSKKRLHKWTTYRFHIGLAAIHTPTGRVLLPEGLVCIFSRLGGRKLRWRWDPTHRPTAHRAVGFICSSPFPRVARNKKWGYQKVSPLFIWYTGRDSNPQPSEPESDALSIEPPVHLLDSLNIIAVFSPFVKPKNKKFSVKARYSSQITVDFCE